MVYFTTAQSICRSPVGFATARGPHVRRVLFFLSLFLAGCASLRPPLIAPPSVSIEQVRDHLRSSAPEFHSFKSLTKVEVDYQEKGKHRKQSFDGALLHRVTGQSRLQGFGFMGKKVFDLLYSGDTLEIYVPSSGLAYEGSVSAPGASAELDVFVMIRRAIIDTAERYTQNQLQWSPDDPLHPWVDEGNGRFVVLEVNPTTLSVDKKTIVKNGTPVATIFYGDYQDVEGRVFPLRIGLSLPQHSLSIAITFDTLTFDEAIPDSRFSLLMPPRTTRLPLSKLDLDFLTKAPGS